MFSLRPFFAGSSLAALVLSSSAQAHIPKTPPITNAFESGQSFQPPAAAPSSEDLQEFEAPSLMMVDLEGNLKFELQTPGSLTQYFYERVSEASSFTCQSNGVTIVTNNEGGIGLKFTPSNANGSGEYKYAEFDDPKAFAEEFCALGSDAPEAFRTLPDFIATFATVDTTNLEEEADIPVSSSLVCITKNAGPQRVALIATMLPGGMRLNQVFAQSPRTTKMITNLEEASVTFANLCFGEQSPSAKGP